MIPLNPHEVPGGMPSPGAQPTGPAAELALTPGLPNGADLWRDQVEGLADAARIRVADITRGAAIEELARDILAEAGPRVSVIGFSLGGSLFRRGRRMHC